MPAEHTAMFGLFAFSGKVTSFIGPLLYGWLVVFTGHERSGMAIVIILLLLAIYAATTANEAS